MKPLPADLTIDDPLSWNFVGCPAAELWSCYMYEFFREFSWARKSVAEWRETHQGNTFDDWLGAIKPRSRDRPGYELYAFCPEWPPKPYLSILPTERQRRLRLIPKLRHEHQRGNALRLVNLPAVCQWCTKPPWPGLTRVLPPTDRPTVKEDDFHETICVTVDWRHHPRTIAKMFEELLVQRRPKDVVHWKIKGKGRLEEQLRARLKALGAWRLLVKYKMTWEEAEEQTAKINPDGIPLFDGQSHWLRARKQAEQYLDNPYTFGLAG